jgi:hypothetical protein
MAAAVEGVLRQSCGTPLKLTPGLLVVASGFWLLRGLVTVPPAMLVLYVVVLLPVVDDDIVVVPLLP